MSILKKIFGDSNARAIKDLEPLIEEINSLEKDYVEMSDEELRNETNELKQRLKKGESLDDILPEAFALVREAAKRTLGQRHFDVQLMGGIVLHKGQISEMKTGEGKTLVSTLPAYLNALTGSGVHIVTVNDYLSRRDMVWMGQVFDALGLSVGCINHDASFVYDATIKANDEERDASGAFKIVEEFLRPCLRSEAYSADITYGTNNEFGFDYLRDNLVYPNTGGLSVGADNTMVQREQNFAIIDEVDSILIDEARTPLIISAPDEESGELYKTFSKIVPQLNENTDYNIDEKMKAATITEAGIEKVESILGVGDIYTEKGIKYVHHMEQALRARALFLRDRDYVVKPASPGGGDGEIIIVDEFTGRLMPGRRWSEGLHQAIEAKEGVIVQKESRTLASITFQNYFRLYKKLSGMTGTAKTSAEEFIKVYNLEVVEMPTNRPMIRKDLPDKIFQTENGKWKALAKEIKTRHEKGQPVLVGTVSIERNEKLSAMLQREGVAHKVLNAKHHEEEAQITAQAGRIGAVTVATNMAGRGVDIVLGGNPPDDPEQSKKVKEAGGLLVLGTERHEARRIDNQLRGRSGRQGDPGESQFYVSMEDDLMRVFGSDKIKSLMGTFGIPEDEAIENKMISRSLESAQERIEGFNFDARKHVLEYDDVMNKQRKAIYARRSKIFFSDVVETLSEDIIDSAAQKIVEVHTTISEDSNEWNKKEIEEHLKSFGDIKKDDLHQSITSANSRENLEEIFVNYLKALFLAKKEDVEGYLDQVRRVMLQAIDILWMEHLEAMDYVRSSVRLRAYGNRDPLIEYKNEGSRMFMILEGNINLYIANLMFKIGASQTTPKPAFHTSVRSSVSNISVKHPMSDKKEVGRNDPCPCGSGKKYKRCHGI